jgi:cytochrome c553
MGDIAPKLESQVIAALANYYAGQVSAEGHLKDQAGTEGERIYKRGAGKDIPACQSCHGKVGEGSRRAPRLAGQHSEYLVLQLQAFAIAARIADPMNHHVWVMTQEQMQAVASYLGGRRE